MDCLVTGGAGFIGSNLVDALIARGDRVTVIDNLSTGKRANLESALARGRPPRGRRCPRRRGDRRDLRRRRAAGGVPSGRPDRRSLLGRARRRGRHRQRAGDDRRARRRSGRRAPRAWSTPRPAAACTATPTCCRRPRTTPIRPLAPYGQSKYAAEGYCELYTRLHGFSTVSLRYGNVYGPRQDVHGEAGVVAIFCGHLVSGRQPTVFGDGRQTRDWVDVSDVVRANLLAADSTLTGPVNIGHGRETSVLDLLRGAARRGAGGPSRSEPRFEPERPGEVRRSCLDVTRARRRARVGARGRSCATGCGRSWPACRPTARADPARGDPTSR